MGADLAKARALAAQGQEAQAGGDFSRAINSYQQAVNAAPDFGAAWNNMGIALMQRQGDTDFVAAARAFQRAGALLPSDPTPWRNLGLLYQQRGFQNEALAFFDQALAVDAYDRDSLRGAAVCGKDLLRADQASLDRLRRAQLNETDPKWLGIITRERMRVEQALVDRRDRY